MLLALVSGGQGCSLRSYKAQNSPYHTECLSPRVECRDWGALFHQDRYLFNQTTKLCFCWLMHKWHFPEPCPGLVGILLKLGCTKAAGPTTVL